MDGPSQKAKVITMRLSHNPAPLPFASGDEEEGRAHACSDDDAPPVRVPAVAGLGDLFPAGLGGAFGGGGHGTVVVG